MFKSKKKKLTAAELHAAFTVIRRPSELREAWRFRKVRRPAENLAIAGLGWLWFLVFHRRLTIIVTLLALAPSMLRAAQWAGRQGKSIRREADRNRHADPRLAVAAATASRANPSAKARARTRWIKIAERCDFQPVPTLVEYQRTDLVERFTVQCSPDGNVTASSMVREGGKVADRYDRNHWGISITPIKGKPNRVMVTARIRNPASVSMPVHPVLAMRCGLREIDGELEPFGPSVLDGALIGVNDDNREIRINMFEGSTLIAGTAGAGKSTSANTYTAQSARCVDSLIVPLDGKGGMMSEFWREAAWMVGDSNESIEHVLKLLVQIMHLRMDVMKGVDEKITPSPTMPVISVIVDEIAVLSETAMELIWLLVSQGRALGITVVPATQRPTKKLIPGELLANLVYTIGLMTKDDLENRIIFGDSAAAKGIRSHDIEHRGIGYVTGEGMRDVGQVRMFRLGMPDVRRIVAETAPLKQYLAEIAAVQPWCPPGVLTFRAAGGGPVSARANRPTIESQPEPNSDPDEEADLAQVGDPLAHAHDGGPISVDPLEAPPELDTHTGRRRLWAALCDAPGSTQADLARVAEVTAETVRKAFRAWEGDFVHRDGRQWYPGPGEMSTERPPEAPETLPAPRGLSVPPECVHDPSWGEVWAALVRSPHGLDEGGLERFGITLATFTAAAHAWIRSGWAVRDNDGKLRATYPMAMAAGE